MLVRIVRGLVRVSVGLALGAVPGALYGAAVGTVHLGVYGRWDRAPAFAVGCVLVGALFGLLGGIEWALSGEVAPSDSPLPLARGSSQAPLAVSARRPGSAPASRPWCRNSRPPVRRTAGGWRRRALISRRRNGSGGRVHRGGCSPPLRWVGR